MAKSLQHNSTEEVRENFDKGGLFVAHGCRRGGGLGGALFEVTNSKAVRKAEFSRRWEDVKNLADFRSIKGDLRVNFLELCAVFLGLCEFRKHIEGSNVILFVDNNSAISQILRAAVQNEDANSIVQKVWQFLRDWNVRVWFERADSKLNPADEPSRRGKGNNSYLTQEGGVHQ